MLDGRQNISRGYCGKFLNRHALSLAISAVSIAPSGAQQSTSDTGGSRKALTPGYYPSALPGLEPLPS
jgi:hypothetical protein